MSVCKKYKKTKDPKCEEQDGCKWVVGLGCVETNGQVQQQPARRQRRGQQSSQQQRQQPQPARQQRRGRQPAQQQDTVQALYKENGIVKLKPEFFDTVGRSRSNVYYELDRTKYIIAKDYFHLIEILGRGNIYEPIVTTLVDNMNSLFERGISSERDISHWDVSNVVTMSRMFEGCQNFNGDISKWDVSNVTYMSRMFLGCSSFNSDISNWNVSNVQIMYAMFYRCQEFTADLSRWDVSKVNNMGVMFARCSNFNSDISNWNVSRVIDMEKMFYEAHSFDKDISNWDVSNVRINNEMFKNCPIRDSYKPKFVSREERFFQRLTNQSLELPTSVKKVSKPKLHIDDKCQDIIMMDENEIAEYLETEPNAVVLFYRLRGGSDIRFRAICYTFDALLNYAKDPSNILFQCQQEFSLERYANEPQGLPTYLKIPVGDLNAYVEYQSFLEKINIGQNMIFLEYEKSVPKTMSAAASIEVNIVSRYHCQEGSNIDVYSIMF